MVVAHSNVVNEDADVKATNGLLDAWDVGFVTRREVDVNDLRSNALVLRLDVSGHVLELERSPTHLKHRKTKVKFMFSQECKKGTQD